jgi:choline-sulfatase
MTEKSYEITRRRFLNTAAGSACELVLGQARAAKFLKTQKKPNILWIMSDEHNHRVAGCYGNHLIQTPNIDALAENGITFEGHYCNSPLCVPSRLSLTAGKYTSRVDVWGLTCELPDANMPSVARVLNAAGYESFFAENNTTITAGATVLPKLAETSTTGIRPVPGTACRLLT